jgi:hypothetical protein
MDKNQWKRHLKRKALQHQFSISSVPAGTWINTWTLQGPLGPVEIRCIMFDARDPASYLSGPQLFKGLVSDAPPRLIRTLCFRNWDFDPRELWEIPEAREACARLWDEMRPIVRLLTESTLATPADDAHGLPQQAIAAGGLGWWEIYLYGHCRVDAAGREGMRWNLLFDHGETTSREEIKAELFDITADNPLGYSFDAAADRRHFFEMNADAVSDAISRLPPDGHRDVVVMVLSLIDEQAKRIAVALAGNEAVRSSIEQCRKDNLHPGMVISAPHDIAATYLDHFASGTAKEVRIMPKSHLGIITIAHGGTSMASDPFG